MQMANAVLLLFAIMKWLPGVFSLCLNVQEERSDNKISYGWSMGECWPSIQCVIFAVTSGNHFTLDDLFNLAELHVNIVWIKELKQNKKVQLAGRVRKEEGRNFLNKISQLAYSTYRNWTHFSNSNSMRFQNLQRGRCERWEMVGGDNCFWESCSYLCWVTAENEAAMTWL